MASVDQAIPPVVHNPQYYAEVLCASGFRDSPHLAHYPAAALVCEFAFRDFSPSPQMGAVLEETQGALMAWDEIADVHAVGGACEHNHVDDAVRRLEGGVFSDLRRSAHAQIFASILLRSVAEHGVRINCEMAEGLEGLMESCSTERPDARYYGQPKEYWTDPNAVTIPETDFAGVAGRAAGLFAVVQPDTWIDGVKYYLNGEKQHCLANLQAVMDCQRIGHTALAAQATGALRLQIGLSDVSVPGAGQVEALDVPLDLSDPQAWRDLQGLTNDVAFPHAVKRFYTLQAVLSDQRTAAYFEPHAARIQAATLAG